VKAFVADITQDQLGQQLPGPCVDFCSMVFVLSAVTPEKMPQVGCITFVTLYVIMLFHRQGNCRAPALTSAAWCLCCLQ
jgi:hypothetical protein